jgi:hypothetical protein
MYEGYRGSLEQAVESYAHWWREAGLHTAIDAAPHGWREAPAAPFWQRDAGAVREAKQAAPVSVPQQPRVAEVVAPAPRPTAMPDALPAFLDWFGSDAGQPEAAWDGALILPPAIEHARLLVIIEMPGISASDSATLVEPGQRRFIDAMLASLGIKPEEAPCVSLAARRPPGGLLDEATLGRLAQRMTHYLGLTAPGAAIILGDRTSRALIGSHWTPAGDGLHKINHGEGRVEAVSLPGLDLLMGRPAAKAKSWQTLRLLQGMLNK